LIERRKELEREVEQLKRDLTKEVIIKNPIFSIKLYNDYLSLLIIAF
jgi:hypothetical protein